MSYLEQTGRKNPASVAAVVGIHLAVGYALLSGLAITVIRDIPGIPQIIPVNEPPPPPPHKMETQRTKLPVNTNPTPKPDDSFKVERTILPPPTIDGGPAGATDGGGSGPVEIAPPPPKPSLATDAAPARNWRQWITTDDYPTAALRNDVQGLVVISVTIGTDGKVRSCLVTQSSGSKLLDDATCRLYTARARFAPARDADGNPTTAQRTDRYRWQIPNE
jgi:protein TonB